MNHKKFRALLKKFRRKLKRQEIAKARSDSEQKEQFESCESDKETEGQRTKRLKEEEEEGIRQNLLWLEREKQAQEKFSKKMQLEEFQRKRAEEITKQREEEILQQKERAAVIQENKNEVSKLSSNSNQTLGPCNNPIAPQDYNVQGREQCLFFQKTGCCRFGDRCSRAHPKPDNSVTLLIKGMYSHFSIEQMTCDDYDADAGLEYEDNETYHHFCEFYDDVLPEFKKAGKVCQFKVCCNHEPHLRGNVYVQYSRREEAEEAFKAFNSRWYGGKQLSCEFTDVTNWKSAICGLYHRNRCPKGSSCNFLHVFKNPDGEFWLADRNITNTHNKRRHYSDYRYRSPTHSKKFNSTSSHRQKKRHEQSSASSKRNCTRRSSSLSSSSSRSSYSSSSSSTSSSSHSRRKRRKKYSKKYRRKSKMRSSKQKESTRSHFDGERSSTKNKRH